MKKTMSIVALLITVCLLSSCGRNDNQNQTLQSETDTDGHIAANEINGNPGNAKSDSGIGTSRISITAGDTVLYASIYDNQTAQEFVHLLPLTLNAFDRIDLVKSTVLPQSISDNGERTRNYSLGSIFYWPEGPEVAFCYSDHLPETVVEIIHIGMIESGVEFFKDYTGEILIELENEHTMQIASDIHSKDIQMVFGDVVVTAELYDSDEARQFAALLPQTITMSRGRDREYYGRRDGTISYDASGGQYRIYARFQAACRTRARAADADSGVNSCKWRYCLYQL